MGQKVRQFVALSKKNWWLKRRRWILSLVEFVGALSWIVLSAYLASTLLNSQSKTKNDAVLDAPWKELPALYLTDNWLDCAIKYGNGTCVLAVVPDTAQAQAIGTQVLIKLLLPFSGSGFNYTLPTGPGSDSSSSGYQDAYFQPDDGLPIPLVPMFFANETLMEDYYENNKGLVWNAIVFDDSNFFNYTIRTNITYLPQNQDSTKFNPFSFLNTFTGASYHYAKSGVATLQQAIASTLIENLGTDFNFTVAMKELPYPSSEISFASLVGVFISPMYLLAFLPSFLLSLVAMVDEKVAKTKEFMKMMGLPESVYSFSWLVAVTVPIFVISLGLVVINFALGVFHHSNFFFVLLFVIGFSLTVISFCFFAASFCNTTRTCILVGAAWLYVLSTFSIFLPSLSSGLQLGLSIFAPLGFSLGFFMIQMAESTGTGIQFGDDIVNGTSFGSLTFVLFLDSAIYSLLAWYIGNVFPGDWGIPRHPLFPFQPSYWKSVFSNTPQKQEFRLLDSSTEILLSKSSGVEPIVEKPSIEDERREAVRITNLTKIFNEKDGPAVDHLDLSLFRGEIHVLLGHNGAGKTTTIGMLTGLLPPSEGGAVVEGYRLPEQIDEVRQIIGVCPQHDILWEQLTAVEHLRLYGSLKGVSVSQIDETVTTLLTRVGLEQNKWNEVTKGYSGGMKRKLSLAIALIGDSKVVFLDEPTSGMDPVSRRFMYSFLDEVKKDKVIILTTHNMEEADILGDRVSIIARGRLQCCGSSIFLKNNFGVGYFLNILKGNDEQGARLYSLVKEYVPDAAIKNETAKELDVLMPLSAIENFSNLFAELEAMVASKTIVNFSISMTTLEDVFLKIASEENVHDSKKVIAEQGKKNPLLFGRHHGKSTPADEVDPESGISHPLVNGSGDHLSTWTVIRKQLPPLIRKKFIMFLRNRRFLAFLILLPAVFISLNLLSFKFTQDLVNQGVNYNITTLESVSTLNITSVPYCDLTNGSAASVIAGLEASLNNLVTSFATVADLETSVLANYNTSTVAGGYLFADSVDQFNITVFYNDTVSISLPTYINEIHNAILQGLNTNLTFTSSIHPLSGSSPIQLFSSVSVTIFISLALLLSNFGKDVVTERAAQTKWQMLLASMHLGAYWVSTFVMDFLFLLLPVFVVWITLAIFQNEDYTGTAFPALAVLTITFLIPALLSQYVLSNLFEKPDNVIVVLHLLNILSGFLPYIIYIVLTSLATSMDASGQKTVNDITPYISMLFPTGTLLAGLQDLQNIGQVFSIIGREPTVSEIFEWDANIPKRLIFFAGQSIALLVLHYLFEMRALRVKSTPLPPETLQAIQNTPIADDPDVARERERVDRGTSDLVVMKNVYKAFTLTPVVNNISLGIQRGECFGYLGPNGAGKSTSIAMATAQIGPSSGSISLEGNTTTNANQQELYSRTRMGVCLQGDSLFDQLTGREHLQLYCRLRRDMFHLTPAEIDEVVDTWMEEMKLTQYADRESRTYSGGNKRKLCVCIALLLDNRLVFLDEPSSGMDPDARRALWKVIASARDNRDRCVVLTTHSMEEAEAVCDRIGIVVSGRVNCLGTTQHLKSRFGFGYRMNMKTSEHLDPTQTLEKQRELMAQNNQDEIDVFLKGIFPHSRLLEALGGQRTYELGPVPSLSAAFRELENEKKRLGIKEFIITQNSLEQVFMYFAKFQKPAQGQESST